MREVAWVPALEEFNTALGWLQGRLIPRQEGGGGRKNEWMSGWGDGKWRRRRNGEGEERRESMVGDERG